MKRIIIKPEFFDKFQCSGGKCKDTCCQGWAIFVTREEYNNIKNIKKSDYYEELMKTSFVRSNKNKTASNYMKFKLNKDLKCPFFTKEGFCGMQLEWGHTILPMVCQSFPRETNIYPNIIEKNLSCACEEVVKLLMKEEEGIVFEKNEEVVFKIKVVNAAISYEEIEKNPILDYYYDIKLLSLAILQNRDYKLSDRMILLGIAMKQLDGFSEKEATKIPGFVSQFIKSMEADQSLLESFDSVSGNQNLKVLNALSFLETLFHVPGVKSDFFERISTNLGVEISDEKINVVTDDNENNFANLEISKLDETGRPIGKEILIERSKIVYYNIEKYEKAKIYYEKFFSGREYILENIIVCYFLNKRIPFCKKDMSIWENYMYFVGIYNAFIVAMTGYIDENTTEDDIIHCIVMLSRVLPHSMTLFEVFMKAYKDNNTDTLAHMAIMIK